MSGGMPGEVTIASWNVCKGLGQDLRRRTARTTEVIGQLGADVVVLQEADFRLHPRRSALPTPDRRIAGYEFLDLSASGHGIGWHGIAVLVPPEAVIEDIQRFDLPALEPRGAVIATLGLAGLRFRLVGVHLGLIRRNRRAQLHFLRQKLDGMPPCPTVMAGDFNERTATRGLEPLQPAMRTASPGPSFPAGRPFLRLDRFAWSDDTELVESHVVDSPLASIASDHRPIFGRFRLSESAALPEAASLR
ncbi:endonuclease/exonuclease/phosphatase family protein [uncultured Jannaschia sp.]|uniref:endonuclease/exonuclease/phosphatase family protein n=1 Tax=uncultured Jannaschia sp. TaxID=293347 RepID=UPI0026345D61|nr:endonuclease/exonuclease/phosphatase family protein [uncultured Jannaschia sp.]